jgi:hypothetical protein
VSLFEDRMRLKGNGYSPIPVAGKRAVLADWSQMHDVSAAQMSAWPAGGGSGLLTKYMPTLDIDIRHPEAADACAEAVSDWVGESGTLLTRFGRAPKRAIPFQTDAPFKKYYRDFRHPNDKPDDKPHRLEFLCDGQQVVGFGIHPDTGREYSWHGGTPLTVPRTELPGTNEDDARRLLDHCADILMQQFGFVEVAASQLVPDNIGEKGDFSPPSSEGSFDPLEALRQMRPSDAAAADVQPRAIMSLLRRGHHPDEIQRIVVDETMKVAAAGGLGWTRDIEEREVRDRVRWAVNKLCSEFDPLVDRDIPAWLHNDFHADWQRILSTGITPQLSRNAAGWYVRRPPIPGSKIAKNEPEVDARSAGAESALKSLWKKKPHLKDITLGWWKPINAQAFPARDFLYGKHYQRGTVSGTVAPGGSGKTSLCNVEAVAMATGINLLGEPIKQRLRVWYHNAEDSQQEVERRILAICQYYSIEQTELDCWFLATSCELFDLHVARGYNEVKADDMLIAAMCNKISELGIDVVILDPLVNLHDVPEGGNSQMNSVISVFRSIAQSQNCAVEIEQHTRKHPVGLEIDYTGADARGASSVRDAYRAQRVLNHPTKEEARAHGILDHERGLYVRVDVGKSNNSRPGAPVWRHLITATLPNGDDIGRHGSVAPARPGAGHARKSGGEQQSR